MYFIRCMSHRYVIIHVLSSRILTSPSLAKVPPFSSQSAVQLLSAAICVLFQDWLEAEKHSPGAYFPVDRIDSAVEQYLRELATGDAQRVTREGYEGVRRELRRSW
jgi:nuclear pore complex protein Nup155